MWMGKERFLIGFFIVGSAYLKNNIFWDIPKRIFSHVDEVT